MKDSELVSEAAPVSHFHFLLRNLHPSLNISHVDLHLSRDL